MTNDKSSERWAAEEARAKIEQLTRERDEARAEVERLRDGLECLKCGRIVREISP